MKAPDLNATIKPPRIAGIKTNMPGYRLAWHINASFSMNFALNLDWQKGNEDSLSSHQHYFCSFEDVELNWHLINNRGSGMFFFQSKPMFDYLLICNGDDIYDYFGRAVQSISHNKAIDHIFPFDFSLVKSKNSFYQNILSTKQYIEDLHV